MSARRGTRSSWVAAALLVAAVPVAAPAAAVEAALAAACVPDGTTLCIDGAVSGDRRFRIKVDWSTVQGGGQGGHGTAVPAAPIGFTRGGIFWFFQSSNPEMLVKVVNGCSVNQQYWVFSSAGTNVGLTTTVTDTATGAVKTYTNPDLTAAVPVQDVAAFPCSGGGSSPSVTSFSAASSTVRKCQATPLSWTSANATSASIDNGVGDVPTNGSVSVSPAQATTYTLTVANASGATDTRQVTVTVSGAPLQSFARAVNAGGLIVGNALTSAGASRAALFLHPVTAVPRYTVTDLGTLGGTQAVVNAMSGSGNATGSSTTAAGDTRAFLYSGGVMTSLGTLPGDGWSEGRGVADDGRVVGVSRGSAEKGFLFKTGSGMHEMPSPDASAIGSGLDAVNASGLMVGSYQNAQGRFAFVTTEASGPASLPVARELVPKGVNASGGIVLLDDITMANGGTFPYPAGPYSALPAWVGPAALNDAGDVVGADARACPAAPGSAEAMIYRGGQKTLLGRIGDDGVVDLNTLIPAADQAVVTLTSGTAVSASGRIACSTATGRAVILTPTCSPATPFGGGEVRTPGGSVKATIVDETGAAVAGQPVVIAGLDLSSPVGSTAAGGSVTITTALSMKKPAFRYGDGVTYAQLSIPLTGSSTDFTAMGTGKLATARMAGKPGAPLTPGTDATSGDVTVSIPSWASVGIDTLAYDTPDKQKLRAVSVPLTNLGPLLDPVTVGGASASFALLYAVTPAETTVCPAAKVKVALPHAHGAPNDLGWQPGAAVEFWVTTTDVGQTYAPYAGWAKVSDGVVSSDGTSISTVDGGGFAVLGSFAVRLE